MRVIASMLACGLAACFSTPDFHGIEGHDAAGADAADGDGGTDAGPLTFSANVMFVTELPAAIGTYASIDQLDAVCTQRAQDAAISGTFIGWFSTSISDAGARLPATGGWVRPDNKPVAMSKAQLFQGDVLYPPRLDEKGNDLAITHSNALVFTGTKADGTHGSNCNNLTGGGTRFSIAGRLDGGRDAWTFEDNTASCENSGYIYCFETDRRDTPPPPDAQGRIAFVTVEQVSAHTNLATLDQACASAAPDQATYRAFVATNGQTAKSRFTTDGQPWVRPDHVVVTTDLQTFTAPISVEASSSYAPSDYVLAGAASPTTNGTGTTTCGNWTGTAGTFAAGKSSRSTKYAFGNAADASCSGTGRVYCLQVP